MVYPPSNINYLSERDWEGVDIYKSIELATSNKLYYTTYYNTSEYFVSVCTRV